VFGAGRRVIRSMIEAGLHIRSRGSAADKAEASAQLIEQVNQAATASKVLARDPETFQQFVKAASEDGPVTDVYIDAQVLNQSGLADQVLAASPRPPSSTRRRWRPADRCASRWMSMLPASRRRPMPSQLA